MNEWMKVGKLNKGRNGREKERSFRSCTQASSADVCQSVPYEAPLWAELLLVHYGWGAILRHWGCCILIFEWREDDSLLPNPFMRFIQYLMGSDKQVQNVFQHTKEEGGGKQTGMLLKWARVSPRSASHRQCTSCSGEPRTRTLHNLRWGCSLRS